MSCLLYKHLCLTASGRYLDNGNCEKSHGLKTQVAILG